MLRRKELIWFYQQGASFIFPDHWEPYLNYIPEVERGDMMSAYYRRLTSTDEAVRKKAAQIWTVWEMSTSKLLPDPEMAAMPLTNDNFTLAFARIECHYFVHGGWFTPDDQLLVGATAIRDIPGTIVHGRYDVVCPMVNAWDLHKAWPKSELKVIANAGHNGREPGIFSELVIALEKYLPL